MGDFFFAELVKYALLDLKKRDNANRTLISSFIDDLLASPSAPTRPWLTGGFHHFPCRPFFQEIASMLALWGAYRRFPLIFPRFNLLEEVAGDVSQALDEQTPVVVRFFEKYGMLATDSVWSRIFCCRRPKRGKPQVLPPAPAMPVRSARDLPPGPQLSLLAVPWADPRTLLRPPRRRVGALIGELADLLDVRLGEGGIRRLLRMRRTVGAIPHALPPDPDALLACTRPLHDPRAKLTVAGRALTKHGVRCAWWGLPHACNDPAKNKLGEDLVASIIANAAWVNAHCIVHGQPQFEVRVAAGYGCRWQWVSPAVAAAEAAGHSSRPSPSPSTHPADATPPPGSSQSLASPPPSSCAAPTGSPPSLEGRVLVFRGFLEPPVEGGHEARWRHDP